MKKIHLAMLSSLVCLAPSLSALSRSEPKENQNPSQLTTSYLEEGLSEESSRSISKSQPPPPPASPASSAQQPQSSSQKQKSPAVNTNATPSSVHEGAVPAAPPPPPPQPKQPQQPQQPQPTQPTRR